MSKLKKEFNQICLDNHLVGASLIVIKNNKVKEQLHYGYQSIEKDELVDKNTIYRIASVSKLEVAACLMMLYQEGKVDLDEDISTYLGFTVRNPKHKEDKITLKQLMTQTSSITDGLELDDKITGYNLVITLDEEIDKKELLLENGKYASDTFSDYKPGEHFEYSNFGCGLLACIIENVSGEYFFDFFKERIAKPLNINASFQASDLKDFNISSTYDLDGNLIRDKESFVTKSITKRTLGNNYVGPAGGLFINAYDLSLIMMQYMNDGAKILNKDTMDKMLEMTWYGDKCGEYTAKGLQFEILDYFNNRRLYGHFGSAYGVKSFMFFNPYQKLGMVFISNGGNSIYDEDDAMPLCSKALLKNILDTYWDNKLVHNLVFSPSEEYAFLDGRRIKLDYREGSKDKSPSITNIKLLDCLSISTEAGKTNLDKFIDGRSVFSLIEVLDNEYIYNAKMMDAHKDGDYKNNEIRYSYYISYARRDAAHQHDKYLVENYHCHCNYCNHASGKVAEYAKVAYDNGMKVFGMSDHGPIPNDFIYEDKTGYKEGRMDFDKMKNEYALEIEAEKKRYEGKMTVLSSIEIEYVPGKEDYYKEMLKTLDYLVMGQHYTKVDGEVIDAYSNCCADNIIKYAEASVKGMESGLFKVYAHPDIYMMKYMSEKGMYRGWDKNAKKAAEMIIDAAERTGVYLEINSGGIEKAKMINPDGSVDYPYPRSEFWQLVKKHKNVKVVVGADAHAPNAQISMNIERAINFAYENGIKPINVGTKSK